MKTTLLILIGSLLGGQLLIAQPKPGAAANPVSPNTHLLGTSVPGLSDGQVDGDPRFDLDFPGGRPAELVVAIEKASGRPLNVIIPTDFADTELPELRMKQVTVPQLFDALTMATLKLEKLVTGTYFGGTGGSSEQYQQKETGYGFKAKVANPTHDTVWYFFNTRLPGSTLHAPRISRFYNLNAVEQRFTIQDITTAVKTAWDLLDVKNQPTLKYHPETKLLIAVGQEEHLQVVDNVLKELGLRGGESAVQRDAAVPVQTNEDSAPVKK